MDKMKLHSERIMPTRSSRRSLNTNRKNIYDGLSALTRAAKRGDGEVALMAIGEISRSVLNGIQKHLNPNKYHRADQECKRHNAQIARANKRGLGL